MEIGTGCIGCFGIKSYLDRFYDRRRHGSDHPYGSTSHSLSSSRPKFSSRWWKFLLCVGLATVFIGFFLLLLAVFLPRKPINVSASLTSSQSHLILIDRQALAYNAYLDTSRLLGICFVILGGVLFIISLLLPTFCSVWCSPTDSNEETDPLKLRMEGFSEGHGLPVQSCVKQIQPTHRKDESRITADGIVPLLSS